jgi:MoaA/NifB/PqqE/SkfB family radical SAM enzyme
MLSKIKNHYIPELIAYFTGRPRPFSVSFNITPDCNQNCVYCEIGNKIERNTERLLNQDDINWVIDEMATAGIKRLAINGGEPFLYKSLLETVSYAGSKNIVCAITSNGMTIYRLSPIEIAVLKENKSEVNISVDSLDNSINSFTRGSKLALENVKKSAKTLMDAGIPVTFLSAISKYNYQDLYSSLVKAYELGIGQVLYQPLIFYSNYPDRKAILDKANLNVAHENIDILKAELRKILKFERTHNIKTNVYRFLPWIENYIKMTSGVSKSWFWEGYLKKFYCRDIHALIDIAYDGGIQPCAFAKAEINIKDDRSQGLIALWVKASESIKKDLDSGKYRAYCNACSNHFSRNMIASIMKYPLTNRSALIKFLLLMNSRAIHSMYKKLFVR